jgi:putative ABC transport system permease protein
VPNTFDMISQDQILETVNGLTSVFFLVMVALSGVALLVGGIGVMAIMMVSVTDRTREIGLRMAVGATRREILWQFLVEAATLTLLGGLIGIAVGLLAGEVLKGALSLEAGVPLWSAVVAILVSAGIGLAFGVLPANRAARMDPVEALRHE